MCQADLVEEEHMEEKALVMLKAEGAGADSQVVGVVGLLTMVAGAAVPLTQVLTKTILQVSTKDTEK